MTNLMGYVQLILSSLLIVIYVLLYKYQATKLKAIESQVSTVNKTVESQSKLIGDFEKYKALFDIGDFEKRLNLKLDNQRDELNREFQAKAAEIRAETIDNVDKLLKSSAVEWMGGWNELSQIALSTILKQFPTKGNKPQRDDYINKNYPVNSKFFIGFVDDYLDGKIPSSNKI